MCGYHRLPELAVFFILSAGANGYKYAMPVSAKLNDLRKGAWLFFTKVIVT